MTKRILITSILIFISVSLTFSENNDFPDLLRTSQYSDPKEYLNEIILEITKENIYSFIRYDMKSEAYMPIRFVGYGDLEINDKPEIIPLLFEIGGKQIETLWGSESGNWKIINITMDFEDISMSDFLNSEVKEDNKSIRVSSGIKMKDLFDEAIRNDIIAEDEWSLEFAYEKVLHNSVGIIFDMGINNLIQSEEQTFERDFYFISKLRAKLHKNIYLPENKLMTFYITAGTGIELNLSNISEKEEIIDESLINIDNYISLPIIATAGFEMSVLNKNRTAIFGMEFMYKYESPLSVLTDVTDGIYEYHSFVPSAYLKWSF